MAEINNEEQGAGFQLFEKGGAVEREKQNRAYGIHEATALNTNFLKNLGNSSFGKLAAKTLDFTINAVKVTPLGPIIAKVMQVAMKVPVSVADVVEGLIDIKKEVNYDEKKKLTPQERKDAREFDTLFSQATAFVRKSVGPLFDKVVNFVGKITGKDSEVKGMVAEFDAVNKAVIARDTAEGVTTQLSDRDKKALGAMVNKFAPVVNNAINLVNAGHSIETLDKELDKIEPSDPDIPFNPATMDEPPKLKQVENGTAPVAPNAQQNNKSNRADRLVEVTKKIKPEKEPEKSEEQEVTTKARDALKEQREKDGIKVGK